MKKSVSFKNTIVYIIGLLYALLFVYAAVSKLLDFENFRTQLGQSPMLSVYAGIISILVPAIEIVIALALLYQRIRFWAILGAFTLMVMFTTYIIIILNFSSFVPCSCGGVLEKMGWKEHLVFNICFIIIALAGMFLERDNVHNKKPKKYNSPITILLSCFIVGVSAVSVLYLLSENEIHRNNGFLRRYPPHPVTTIKGFNVKYNSYYIAGVDKDRIYLGNTTAPSHVFSIDTTLNNPETINIQLDNKNNTTFYAPQIRIHPPYFFLVDGNVPAIFRGHLSDWKAKKYWQGNHTFSQFEIISPSRFILSGLDKTRGQNVISYLDFSKGIPIIETSQLLEKKIDGVFDTDGMLRYNANLEKVVYVYYYRNEYLTSDTTLKLNYKSRTIDTITQSPIKLAYQDSSRIRKLAKRPELVQQQSAVSGRYLFTKSNRLGKYESEEMLKDASIIDVYDLKKQSYEFSFYLYDYEGEKIKSFSVHGNILIGLSDHYLVLYRLQALNFDIGN